MTSREDLKRELCRGQGAQRLQQLIRVFQPSRWTAKRGQRGRTCRARWRARWVKAYSRSARREVNSMLTHRLTP